MAAGPRLRSRAGRVQPLPALGIPDAMSDRTVTVVGPAGGRDLKLRAEAPLARLLPSVLEAVGAGSDEPQDGNPWRLARSASGEDLLAPHASLAESGVI